jgi:N-acetylmuramoyl-L-alanine amidase
LSLVSIFAHSAPNSQGRRRAIRLALCGTLLFSVLLSINLLFAVEPFVIYTDTQSRQFNLSLIEGQQYISLMDLLNILGSVSVTQKSSMLLQLKVDKHTLIVRPNSTLVVIDGALSSLDEPVLFLSSEWMVPLQFVGKIAPRLTDRKVTYRSGSSRAFITSQPPSRVYVEAAKGVLSSKIAVEVAQTVPFELKRDGRQLTLSLGNRPLESDSNNLTYSDDQIKSLTFDQSDSRPKIRINLNSPDFDIKTSTVQDGRVFLIVISKVLAPPPPRKPVTGGIVSAVPAKPAGSQALSGTRREPGAGPSLLPQQNSLRTITIDVGHGGVDGGSRSANGLAVEKTLVLQIAQRLRYTLQTRLGTQVYLTRENDLDISLDQRALVANTHHSDLFISLHVGYSLVQGWTGVRVYANTLPREENASGPISEPATTKEDAPEGTASAPPVKSVYFRSWARANAQTYQMSETFAEVVQAELSALWKQDQAAPRLAPMKPLTNVTMPAILVELGNLGAESDVKLLLKPQFQNEIAGAIANAVERFKPIYEAQKNAATP